MAQTLTSRKVTDFLANPRTYPDGGLGFGIGGGGIAASIPGAPKSSNKVPTLPSNIKAPSSTTSAAFKDIKSGFNVKSAQYKGQTMLERIKELALEKCAGDKEQAEAFLEGFYGEVMQKSAAFGLSDLTSDLGKSFAGEVGRNFAGSIGKGLAGATIGVGVAGLSGLVRNITGGSLHNEFLEALQEAVATNPILKQAKKDKVMNYANTIFKFAPHVAADANLLSSILANAIHGEGIDPQTIKTLTDLENRYNEAQTGNTFSPRSYV